MNRNLFLIGLGGLIGGIARYVTVLFFSKLIPSAFPFGTFAVNFVGCFFIGVVCGLADRSGWLTPEWRIFLATGVCGGYTTFSAFAYENVRLLQTADYFTFAAYSFVSFTGGLLAVFIGLMVTKI